KGILSFNASLTTKAGDADHSIADHTEDHDKLCRLHNHLAKFRSAGQEERHEIPQPWRRSSPIRR
ncbi:MAG: hypothetical protein MK161_04030, partial [Pirellulales bacterium]|nr:hypothetical protein [Pirellulales bacterium]